MESTLTKSTDPGLANALGWIAKSRHSGTLKLNRGGVHVDELAFVDGALFLPVEHSLAARLANGASEGEALRRVARRFARELAELTPGPFRFRRIEPSVSAWTGPLPTALILMELAVVEPPDDGQLDDDFVWAAVQEAPPQELPLQSHEELLLSRLGRPASVRTLCRELDNDPQRWHEAVIQLEAAGLVRPATPEEAEEAARVAAAADIDAIMPPAPETHPAAQAIWRDQFQLTADPFTLTPDPAFLYLSDGHAEALAGLKLGIWERRGLIVMIGEVGTGKTTLVYSLLSNLDPDIETAYLSNTLLSFEEILSNALQDFGVPCTSRRRIDLIETLNGFLRRCATQGKTVVLVIDEAQNLSDEVFEGLRLLLNFETYKSKLLQILLVGQPELAARLNGPGLRQVRDRIAVRCHLNPLSSHEARGYVDHRLEMVGGTSDLFTRPALGLLIRRSKGIPRRINILCHNSMLFAYGHDRTRVNRAVVAQAIRDIEGSGLRHE